MVELGWIKMFLFLILGLQFTAVTGQSDLYITFRDGDEATLSCESVMTGQGKCDRTDWYVYDSTNTVAVDLVKLGQIGENAKAKSARLSFTADCSLVIKKITVEDASWYICRQYDRSGRQDRYSRVYLSVVSMTEHKDSDKVKLNCFVPTRGGCRHTFQWVYEGNDQDVITQHMKESQSYCSATVEFTISHLTETSKYSELFKCRVTDDLGEVQQFAFIPPSSDEDIKRAATTTTTTTPTTPTTTTMRKSTEAKMNQTAPTTNPTPIRQHGWLRFLIVSLGLTALIIIVVSVYIWARTKGNKTQISDNAVHDDGDEATVVYENVGEPSASIRLH